MAAKNLNRTETNYLCRGELDSLIREFYELIREKHSLPVGLKPHWDLLKGLLIASRTMTTETTDELLAYILAAGEISRDRAAGTDQPGNDRSSLHDRLIPL
jgi:hypothetical protein